MEQKMKSRKFSLLVAFCLLVVFTATSCKDEGTKPIEPKELSLVGTKWKLVAFVDAENNEITEPELKDCEECYTLEFVDATATIMIDSIDSKEYWLCSGKLALSPFEGFYIVDYTVSTIYFQGFLKPAEEELYDGSKYYAGLYHSRAFELKDNELKLHYYIDNDDEKNYLLFRRLK